MDGSDMAFDYKAVAAGIARSEGMGALLPVVEKELLHYRILSAMQDGGFFGPIVFQGGTSLRLCHGSPRYSEDLDFAGGTGFGVDTQNPTHFGNQIRQRLVQVRAHGASLPAWIEGRSESITVLLDDATHGIAPGQAVVCYDGDRVVGSATIAATAR